MLEHNEIQPYTSFKHERKQIHDNMIVIFIILSYIELYFIMTEVIVIHDKNFSIDIYKKWISVRDITIEKT